MKKGILLLLVLLVAFVTYGQKMATIKGSVITEDIRLAANISVLLKGTTYGGATNQKGEFEFQAPEGNYTLLVSSLIFDDVEKAISIKENSVNRFDGIRLVESMTGLNEVVVTGTRTEKRLEDVPVLTKVVSEHEIAQAGGVSALDALEASMPGIQFSPDPHGNNMSVQGLDTKYILVLVDGERMVGETRGNVNFDRISAGDIKQIEIINGASSVLYGSDAIGGVVNIITKKTKKSLEGNVAARYSNFNTLNTNFSVGTRQDKFSLRVSGFRNSSNGYDLTPETPESYTANPFVDYSITTKLEVRPNNRLTISGHGTLFTHENLNPETSLKSTHRFNINTTLGAKVNYDFSEDHNVTFSVNSDKFNAYDVFPNYDDSLSKRSDYQYSTFVLTDRYHWNDELEFMGGLEMNIANIFSETLFGTSEGADKNKSSNDLNAFAQADWKIVEDVELIGGIRYTHHDAFGDHFTPNLSAMYSPFKRLKFRGTAALGYRSPSLKELYYNFDHQGMFWIYGNENLKPENSTYFSLSTEYNYKEFNMSLNFYHNLIENKIEMLETVNTVTDKIERHHSNISEAQLRGFETFVNWQFLSNFKTKLGYAFSDAIDKSTGLQISGNSKHTGTSSLTFFTKSPKYPLSITISGRLLSPRLYQVASQDGNGKEVFTTEKTEAYSLWKIVYIQKFPKWKGVGAEISGGINNIFDYSNLEKSAVLNPGRTFWVGLSVKF